MNDHYPTEDQLNTIREFLQQKVSPTLVILFGSAAQGRLRPDSDIDLAFLSDRQLNEYDVFMIAQELAELLGQDVDLVYLRNASTVLTAQIIGKGKVILEKDEAQRMAFAMNAFKNYAKLNEERQCILDRFKERGLHYAE